MQSQPVITSPQEFGLKMESGHWEPVWPEVSKACTQLIKCSCKGNCTQCKCVSPILPAHQFALVNAMPLAMS